MPDIEVNKWKAWSVLYLSCAMVASSAILGGGACCVLMTRATAERDKAMADAGLVQRIQKPDGYPPEVVWARPDAPTK